MSPDKEIRILIVDDQREVARVLRTSLELLERGYHIIDVPSAEEALLEPGPHDLLVTDFRLPGISGLELVRRMRGGNPALQSIIITGYTGFDPEEMADELESLGVLNVMDKPIEMEDFVTLVADALGEQKSKARPGDGADKEAAVEMGPIAIVLSSMRAELAAEAVVLVDRQGRVVQLQGTIDEDLRFSELVVLLAGNFTTTGEVATYLGDEELAAIHYYGGGNRDVYTVALGPGYFMAIIYPAGSNQQMDAVIRLGARAPAEILPLVGEALGEEAQEEPAPDADANAEAEQPEPEPAPEPIEEDEPEEEVEVTAPDSIDLDALQLALDAAQAEDADSFWENISEDDSLSSAAGRAISLEEAIDLGLIPKDLGDDE